MYFSPANKKFYTIVKYYPNEFSYFRCGYMNDRVKIKSEDGKNRTVNIEELTFID